MLTPSRPKTKVDEAQLRADLQSWWEQESGDWDALVNASESTDLPGGEDLWDDMPTVDSKAVARMSPIFERHIGIPLKTKLIRVGGYTAIEDVINDLVPQMVALATN